VNLSRWSLRYPVTAGMTIVTLLLIGAVSSQRLPLAFLPEVDFPGLEIQIPYPNALPAQVEEEIVRPAEEALSTLSRVRSISSRSSSNEASIFVQFDWGEDIGPLRVEAREKLERIRDQLPADVDRIQVNGFRSTDIPVLECRIAADRDLSRDYDLLDRHVADPLRRIPGVAKVELYGVERPGVQIDFRLADLRRHGKDASRVLEQVDAANRSVSAGTLRRGDSQWPMRVVNQFTNVDEIRGLPLDARGLRLADLADVNVREPVLDYGRHLDSTRAIGLNVIKESGANTVLTARRARAVLEAMKRDPALQGIRVLTFTDQAADIEASLRGLLEAGLVGALLATAVLFFFLRHMPTTLLISLAIPVSILSACGVLYFTGRTLNILSMMGLMLAVGMLVDNAVVVLESIYRYRQKGLSRLHASLRGAKEVLPAVISATATSIIVFLPLVLGGRTEITTWIGEVGRTIIYTLLCSLFISLTAIPLVSGRVLRSGTVPTSGAIEWLTLRYQRILGWTLRHRPAAFSIAFGVVVLAVLPFSKVNKSGFAGTKVESVQMMYQFTDNLNLHEVERYVSVIEDWILARRDSLHVKSTYSYFTANFAVTRAYLQPSHASDEGAQKVRKVLRERLPALPGARIRLGNDDDSGPSRMGVNLYGEPGPRLDELAQEVKRRLALVEGLTDVEISSDQGREEIEVTVNRERATRMGLSAAEVGRSVALFFRGRPLSRFRGPDGEVEMRAQLAESDRQGLGGLRDLMLTGNDGAAVPLAAVADFRKVSTPGDVERQQRRSVVSVRGNSTSSKGGDVRKAVERVMKGIHFPSGYEWAFGRSFQDENETQKEMMINLLLALVLVYIVMAALFESLIHPFAIMFALPFAFVGIAWICFLTGSPFNIMSQIGLLILVGIVVNNGIVLLHHVHQLRERGMERTAALMAAARDRLRPILMTMATTVLGLLPLAIGRSGVGDVLYYPLARTVIGGLVASTGLTLVLVPCLYTLLEDGVALVRRVWTVGPRSA
jgi:HAE1 family hydrophobic/amphiphilic exporter-1